MVVPIELRRLLIGDPYGDFNFLKFPDKTSPRGSLYIFGTYYQQTTAEWFQLSNVGSFRGGIRSLHLRYMRASYGTSQGGVGVNHAAPSFAAGAVARFGLGSNPALEGAFLLGGGGLVQPTSENTYYEIRGPFPPSTGWWRITVLLFPSGGTQDLDEVRLWEFIDIEPYLEDLIPADSDTEVFQTPFGRYFVGTHYRWTAKRLTITLLFSRTEATLRKQLEGLLTKPSARYPLELFVDGYLFRCAPASLKFEPVGGLVVRAIMELQLLQPYGYHQNRYLTVSPPTYPLSNQPIRMLVSNDLITAETPCEIRVNPGSSVNGYKIRVRVVPADQTAIFVLNGTEADKVISFREDGKVYIASKDTATTVADVTNQVDISSQLPFVLHPGTNFVFVEYLNSNNNPLSDTNLWQIACAFNPRCGEVTAL
jgi:hypothetical protein